MTATTLSVKDGNNNPQTLQSYTVSSNQLLTHTVGDPVTGTAANVLGTGLAVATVAQASGGNGSTYFNASLGATVQQIKSSAGNLYQIETINLNAAVAYLQIFFLPSASVTIGSTAPNFVVCLSASQARGASFSVPIGASGTGLSIACTTGPANSSAGSAVVSAIYA
jgi:hypothetical protein